MSALSNRVALVTGSSRGIGAAIAQLFAKEGAKVILHGRDKAALSRMHDRLERTGGQCLSMAADLRRYEEVEGMRIRAERELGPIDLLVANAGGNYAPPGPLEEMSEEGWKKTVVVLDHRDHSRCCRWRGDERLNSDYPGSPR